MSLGLPIERCKQSDAAHSPKLGLWLPSAHEPQDQSAWTHEGHFMKSTSAIISALLAITQACWMIESAKAQQPGHGEQGKSHKAHQKDPRQNGGKNAAWS